MAKKLGLILKIQKKWLFWLVTVIVTSIASFYILYLNNIFHQEYVATMTELSRPLNFGPRSRVHIDFGNGSKRAFEGRVLTDMSAKIILLAASEAGGLDIVFAKDQKKVSAVDGIKSGTTGKWGAYLNDEKNPIGDLSAIVRPGDKIILIYR